MQEEKYVKTYTPKLTITKSDEDKNDNKWYIEGYASTDAVDTDGEIIEPAGIDYSYFQKSGWITYEHEHGANSIIGEPIPDKIYTDSHGLYMRGVLYQDSQKAQEVWDLNRALQKDSVTNRSLGFSVEGMVNKRSDVDPNVITGMTLTAVTVTTHPANLEARWREVDVGKSTGFVGYEIDPNAVQDISALRLESLGSIKTRVANAISTLSYVSAMPNVKSLLKDAESFLRDNGTLNRNSLSLLLQLSDGISRGEAQSFINDKVRGV